ncbi:c-x8-c-x5-c-x3-h type zinc finger protein [Colletotrichum limetticola]|uniref:C-x8-c-x5-c-x3-h type zinc finger protein n=1 Tax=Colletotrichum limetticola TaxID=1209924 RepID=A0ABQ9PJ55_9PEZI|nr:c-x8-c-x5-c-x3-h type zinc finger protein [Colletotrichum limetticola]
MDGPNNLKQYARQLEIFRHQDQVRGQMISEILTRLENLQRAYQDKCYDYNNEVESRRWWQTKAQNCDGEMQAIRKTMKSNPFIHVVIDGDDAVFQDSAGRDGGFKAGHLLYSEIMNYVSKVYLHKSTQDWSVVVQVILHLDGLAKRLHASGIIPNTAADRTLADFGHGFSRAQPLFNFVDVGPGKEAADHKIRETLRLMVRNNQCKHIFFGPCHDHGYLPVLELYNVDPGINSRLTLIETIAAGEGSNQLNLRRIAFPSIFRSEKLPGRMRPKGAGPPTLASSQSSGGGAEIASSWATVSIGKTVDISSKKLAPKKYYLLNVHSQRVDEQLPPVNQAVEEQFQERTQESGKNLCNDCHLHGRCPVGDICAFLHGAKLRSGELTLLITKSRGIPCNSMSEFQDANCMLGHHCRWLKSCNFRTCRFDGYHDIDPKPRVKIFEDGTTQVLAS